MKAAKLMKRIGTHNGKFHADEVLSCFMLQQPPQYNDSEIIRTRDPEVLDKCDVVVDVGGKYDYQKNRFDHHQRGFCHTMKSVLGLDFGTKLSSAGLIYAHFGIEIIRCLLAPEQVEDKNMEILFRKVYEKFLEEIDAGDNGIPPFDGPARYSVTTTLASRVGNLNPAWNEKHKEEDKCFHEAVSMAGKEFKDRVQYLYRSWLPARVRIQQALDTRFEVDDGGEIMCLPGEVGLPWKEHFFELETDLPGNVSLVKYVLFQADKGDWRVQCIPVGPLQPFESRLPLPESWRGLRSEQLDEVTEIEGCIFCHASGFIGGHKTKTGALAMARKSLKQQLH